ncbi:ABC-F family ATP-binding cassette domain-containing protein [Oricola thermophila]|uniref:ABC-F family ATP-binding cassette domain-containing protein n=1 Tax=Oricola thermophila TaxID=2742145 RepID=A0A6N1VER2_9HYPH|nr:ABC-F family ATP-binding cassette domain-containing protein [Oricola thermophila]QKV19441.1 ABC-F family ATP-binding cassette domain-containing protein [Oricola thermophila]
MSAAIILSDISWSAPDGTSVLSGIDLSFGPVRTGLVGRNGTGKTTLLNIIAGNLAPRTGSVAAGGSIALLRQAVSASPGETVADLFGAREGLALLARAERGEATAAEMADADWTLEIRVGEALSGVGLDISPGVPLAALSGGQQTRARLAALVFAQPDFLLLDEPTNNLDREGRESVVRLLSSWRCGAIVVSHDRELLECMDAIVELSSLGAAVHGGNWSHYVERKAVELEAARHDLAVADRLVAEGARRSRLAAERKARRDSAGRRRKASGGVPRILLGKMKDTSEATGGAMARLAERRERQASDRLENARKRVEVLQPLSVSLPASGLPAGRTVLAMEAVTGGYEPERPVIRDLDFAVAGPERIAVTGPNGSGKTTLLALAVGALRPFSGTVRIIEGFAFLDQQVTMLDPAVSILANFRRLHPDATDNACRAALARFMFRADAALRPVASLSGGQILRAGLACVFGGPRPPGLLVLDEPTNHLDIDSIESVEAGLLAYDGALLVVSHDETFLSNIGITRRLELPAR